MSSKRTTRIQRAAEQLIEGKSVSEIAEIEGVSRSTASRDVNSDQCRQIVLELVDRHRDRIDQIFESSLKVIEAALNARQRMVTPLGEVVNVGPDHYARMNAIGRFTKLITVGRPAAKPSERNDDPQAVTWDQIRKLMENSRAESRPS